MYSKEQYNKEIAPKLKEVLKAKTSSALPQLKKITINAGIGAMANNNKKIVDEAVNNIALIAGQKPVVKKAKKAISNFKLRENMPVGVSVTLRGQRMYDFFGKFIDITCPRIRDFRGFSLKSFDGKGNYSIGLKEHTVFPEINPDDLVTVHGLQINIETTAGNDQDAIELFNLYKFPFRETTEAKKN
jgi:large subunit ribosomal protein L5